MSSLGIIADDLTGAADTGIQFAKRGIHTILLPFALEDADLHSSRVVVLNTATRGMEARQAYDTVKSATALLAQKLRPQMIYKKIDSTLRGNVGAEIEAIMDAIGSGFAIVSPAFPACGRTTAGGVHFVNGQPLARTEAAADPVHPVNESHIPTLIQSQTKTKVGHIALEAVRDSIGSLKHAILEHLEGGEKIIVFDAVTDDDLSSIAEAGMSMSPPPLMVGSAGLADQLSILASTGMSKQSRESITAKEGISIIISGSLSGVTSRQLDAVRRTGRARIVPAEVHTLIEKNEIVSEITSAVKTHDVVGVQSVRGSEHGAQNGEISLHVVECLGKIALQIIENCPQAIRGLILTGGDTALAVFKHLGISQVRLIDEILPGIPYSQVVGGKFAGLAIITKAGAFGDESALVKCVQRKISVDQEIKIV